MYARFHFSVWEKLQIVLGITLLILLGIGANSTQFNGKKGSLNPFPPPPPPPPSANRASTENVNMVCFLYIEKRLLYLFHILYRKQSLTAAIF